MRISDWSSDVCSSDLTLHGNVINAGPRPLPAAPTVRDLLGSIHDVKADTYLPMAALIRRDPESGSRIFQPVNLLRSEEHTSELQSLMRISYAVFCLKKKNSYLKPPHSSTPETHYQ